MDGFAKVYCVPHVYCMGVLHDVLHQSCSGTIGDGCEHLSIRHISFQSHTSPIV